jgi:hypothetical protein
MKKLIIIMLVVFVALATYSQSGVAYQFPVIAGDTITDTGTANIIIKASGQYKAIGIQPIVTKVSGTVAGNCILYASQDGVNYKSTGDTLACANQTTNTALFKVIDPAYTYYKIVYTGSGTMVAKWKVWYTERKQMVIIATP